MLIECRQLNKAYITDNQIVVILGQADSGKTTSQSLIGGLTKPDAGTAPIDSSNNWKNGDRSLSVMRNRTIDFIFLFASLIPPFTAVENLLLPTTFGPYAAQTISRAEELFDKVGLADKCQILPRQLLASQQRRVAIARASINNPAIISADEPTDDLDADTEVESLRFFSRLQSGRYSFFGCHSQPGTGQKTQRNARLMSMKNDGLTEGEEDAGSC